MIAAPTLYLLSSIMAFVFSAFFETKFFAFKTSEKTACFHCGEKMHKSNALTTSFDCRMQPVCCHGCLAILRTVEQNKLVAEYMRNKVGQTLPG
ncbi:MAG: heavy metal translocating P-type ATPase metal-binding domain-containing protein [Pseudomonadota bacterium]